MEQNEPAIAVVIVNYRTPDLVGQCLDALLPERSRLPGLHVIVVDGGSQDGSAEQLSELINAVPYQGWVSFLPLRINGGFGWANNQALLRLSQQAQPPTFVHLLNPDAVIEADAVGALSRFLSEHPGAAAAGSQLLRPDGTCAASAFRFPTLAGELARGTRTGLIEKIFKIPSPLVQSDGSAVQVDWVTGASVMFRLQALRDVGLFDDGFFLYHEEVELMWRLREAGWTVWHVPASRVMHVEGASTGVQGKLATPRRQARLPDYWYRSRRRLLALLYGRPAAITAGWLWVAGHVFWRVRYLTGLAARQVPIEHELRDHLRHAVKVGRAETIRRAPRWDSSPGEPPGWMERG